MKIRCAWCGKDMGEKDGEGVEGVSHSVCEDCYEKLTPGDDGKLGHTIVIRRPNTRSGRYTIRKEHR